MKKSCIISFFLLPLFFLSCKNFMNGSNLTKDIYNKIEYVNLPEVEVLVSPEKLEYGYTLPNNAAKYKIGESNSIAFTPYEKYQFVRWEVVIVKEDSVTPLDSDSEVITFTDKNSLQTKFTVNENVANLQIRPVCYARPYVTNNTPKDNGTIYTKDTSIYITFNREISKDSNFNKIQILSDEESVKNHYDMEIQNEKTLVFIAKTANLIPFDNEESKEITVVIPKEFYTVENEEKISIVSEYSWSFQINNKTNAKAEINFFVNEEEGIISPSNVNEFNIGETFPLVYTPTEDYEFVEWKVLKGGEEVPLSDIYVESQTAQTNVTVYKPGNGISISPVTRHVLKYTTNVKNSITGIEWTTKVKIFFNTEMDTETLSLNHYENGEIQTRGSISIQNDNTGEDLSQDFELSVITENNKTTVVLFPKKSLREKFTRNLDINIQLKQNVIQTKENEPLTELNNSWTYRINTSCENIIPEISLKNIYRTKENNIYKNAISLLSYLDLSNPTTEQLKRIPVKNTVYLNITGKDEDSGLAKLHIKEYSEVNSSGERINELIYDSDENPIPYNPDNFYEYTLKSEDGIVRLELCFIDNAENLSDIKTVYLLKDTQFILDEEGRAHLSNNFNDFFTGWMNKPFTDDSSLAIVDFYKTTIKWKNFADCLCKIGDTVYKTDSSDLTYEVLWGENKQNLYSTSGKLTFSENDEFNYQIPDNIDYSKNLYIEFRITDIVGNLLTIYGYIPKKAVFYNYSTRCYTNLNSIDYVFSCENPDVSNTEYLYSVSTDPRTDIELKNCYKSPFYSVNDITEFTSETEAIPYDTKIYSSWEYLFGLGNMYTVRFSGPLTLFFNKEIPAPISSNPPVLVNVELSRGEQNSNSVLITGDIENYDPDLDYYISAYRIANEEINYLNPSSINHESYMQVIEKYSSFYKMTVFGDEGFKKAQLAFVSQSRNEYYTIRFFYKNKADKYSSCIKGLIQKQNESQNDYCIVNVTNLDLDTYAPEMYETTIYDTCNGVTAHMRDSESGLKEIIPGVCSCEYFWIPYSTYVSFTGDGIPDNLTGTELDNYKKIVGYGSYTNGLALFECNFKDLKDEESYVLCLKVYDNNDNYFYNFYDSYKIPKMLDGTVNYLRTDDGKYVFNTIGESSIEYLCSYFDTQKNVWKYVLIEYNALYAGWGTSIPLNDCYVRVIDGQEKYFRNKYNQTPPAYFYAGNQSCVVKNMIDGIGGVTIFCDAPCLYYICSSEIGYGNDLKKWQFWGQQISPRQVSSNTNVDVSEVPDGDYYVVVAHYADGTVLMSDVHQKK